jgi:hypothetical protein
MLVGGGCSKRKLRAPLAGERGKEREGERKRSREREIERGREGQQ